MDTLSDDLTLLALDPDRGRIREPWLVKYGLAGSELIRLVARGLVKIDGGRLVAPVSTTTGDALLDVALASIAGAGRPTTPKKWVSKPRNEIVRDYLEKLAEAGRIQQAAGVKARWWISDQAAAAGLRVRLDAIATGTGMVDLEQAAFGGLAHAVHLDRWIYRGWDNRAVRKRMKQVAQGRWTMPAADTANLASHAAISAATQAAIAAAIDAAVDAATAAATTASTA